MHVAFLIMSCLRGKSVGASERTKLYSLLNIKTPVQEVIDAVKKELAIPIRENQLNCVKRHVLIC